MSVLELHGRPYTVFDPSNKQHRRYYSDFVRTHSWGSCPVRFVVPEDHGDLITMIQRTLVKYYVAKEFPPVAQKQRRRTKKKPLQQ
jgi:hypothetical protein